MKRKLDVLDAPLPPVQFPLAQEVRVRGKIVEATADGMEERTADGTTDDTVSETMLENLSART